jgi:multiple sugar transport system substrate-binding protein
MKGKLKLFLFGLIMVLLTACGKEKGDGIKEITIMGWAGAKESRTLEGYLQKFHEENPDIKVKVDMAGGNYWPKVQTMITGGSPPDIMYMGVREFKQYSEQGALLDLDEFISENDFDDLEKSQLDAFRNNKTGKLQAFPKDWSTYVVYYNKDMFKDAGLPTPNELYKEGKWTYDEFLKMSKLLTTDEHHGLAMESGRWRAFVPHEDWLDSKTGKININNEKFINRIQFMADLWLENKVAPNLDGMKDQAPADRFMTGKAAMFISGRWMAMGFKASTENWDVAPMPELEKEFTWVDLAGYAIPRGAKYPEASWKVIEYLTSEEVQKQIAKSGQAIPIRKSVMKSDEFKNSIEGINNIAHLEVKSVPATNYPENWIEAESIINSDLERVWIGEKKASEIIPETQKKVDSL